MSGELFGPIFVPERFREAVSGGAWLRAMLEAEGALARAGARAGVVPPEAAEEISRRCRELELDPEELGERGRAAGNPVPALVKELTAAVPGEAARHVHRGATSQDITDTAAMLISREALGLILRELDGVCAACARLAEEHRETLVAGRTLLQQALPTTFGLKAAGWLVAALEARRVLREARERGLAAQLGGAAGTLASLGERGTRVLREYARLLALPEPALPWHAARFRVAELGGALALAAGTLHKVALDVILMAQTEVGEAAEPSGGGRGGSSTLPHKRNPILSVVASANARRVQDLARTLYGSLAQEHERAAGAWHAEWEALSGALALTGGAAAAVREALEGLEVRPGRMAENLAVTEGLILAENVTTLAAERLGRLEAHELVEAACRRVAEGGGTLREEILAEPRLREALSEEEIEGALDPARYLGAADEFVDRALEMYRREGQR
ncbi:3-carboxy-cis,cis-muconate cycloisomerase [Rubrobacter xylanophilus DSM 9941]|uniref:3-carboxy-cis,cis-muconate cycloisomerase n=1 Tax=Rubrobacter xylanophilus (strain DSM 9941 / JCM 11954 / NBRC 16129 / PRD-1) TaxID=266117 RepID=Q1AVN7_RUBXD|nr:3-carboxy-cis,cis-muconate cycloisomerase [Rubrobacter xylanophilus]ABG04541.1 3-carboxy-cis,cis-muconate cycloisomerase [Rubrobacter xylanophilus DSM 9941]